MRYAVSVVLLLISCCANAQEKPEVFVERGVEGLAEAVAISPDHRYLAAIDGRELVLWDVESGRELRRVKCFCKALAFSNDSRILVTASHSPAFRLIRDFPEDKGELGRFQVPTLQKLGTFGTEGADRIAVSPKDGSLFTLTLPRITSLTSDPPALARISLWNIALGSQIRTYQIAMRAVPSWVNFAAGGKYVTWLDWLDGNTQTLVAYDTVDFRMADPDELRWAKLGWSISTVGMLSSDGRLMATREDAVRVYSVVAPKASGSGWPATNCVAASVAFSNDSQFLTIGCNDGSVDLYSVSSSSLVPPPRLYRSFGAHLSPVHALASSRDGIRLFTGLQWWDTASLSLGRILANVEVDPIWLSASISPDGRYGVTWTYSKRTTFTVWDLASGVKKRDVSLESLKGNLLHAVFTPDSKSILIRDWSSSLSSATVPSPGVAALVDPENGSIVRTFPDVAASAPVAISDDGKYIAGTSHFGKLTLWSFNTGKLLHEFPVDRPGDSYDPYFMPDRNRLLAYIRPHYESGSDLPSRLSMWDLKTGLTQFVFNNLSSWSSAHAVSPNGRTIVAEHVINHVGGLRAIDAQTGEGMRRIPGDFISGPAFVGDNWVCTSSLDKIIRIWNVQSGEELLRLMSFQDGEWIIMTPEGYYKASSKGDSHLSVRIGGRVYGIDQWRRTFDRPQIVEAALRIGSTREAIASVVGSSPVLNLTTSGVTEPPSIEIQSPATGSTISTTSTQLAFTVNDSQRAIESVSIFVNGRQVSGTGDRNLTPLPSSAGPTRLTIPTGQRQLNLTVPVSLDPGSNRIEVSAFNGIAEARKNIEVLSPVQPRSPSNTLPNLWILAIGVNNYQSPIPSLSYAVDDARAIADAFAKQQGKVFGEVHTLLITDSSQVKPTFDNIVDNLNYLKKAGQFDVVLLFVAGHGLVDTSGDFYFLPSDAAISDNGEVRRSRAVSWRDLKSVLDVPAKKIILLDACHSEGVSGRKTRGVEGDMLVRELQDTRGVIISSSRGKELSQESQEWQHGAFTYALLEGMAGKASAYGGKVSMLELAAYVSRRVPLLTNGAQHPITDTSGGYEQLEVAQVR